MTDPQQHSGPNAIRSMSRKRKTRRRTTLLTAALQNRICGLLRDGCNVKTACNISGIGETTYHEWKNRGRSGEEPYASFFSETSRARDTFKASLLKIIFEAADKEACHAEWLLERGWPNEFGRSEARQIIIAPPQYSPPPPQVQRSEPRTSTEWIDREIPFSPAQLKFFAELRSDKEHQLDGKSSDGSPNIRR